MFGIDVSQNQGEINWGKVKSQIDFAILRLGWIGNKENHTLDTQFERNYSECKRLGIPVGVYVYCYSNCEETAKFGANWAIAKLQGKSLELPIYIDMEDNSIANQGKDILTNICIAFNTIIEQAGFWAGVYANKNWYDNYLDKDEIKRRYTTWIATYIDAVDKYKGEYDIWQNSSKERIDGITGHVDTNYMYRDLITEIKGKVEEELENGSDEQVRKYKNGSTKEEVYADLNCTIKIGSLDPREECDCFGIFNDRAMVRYNVSGTNNFKIGFCRWLGGVK